MQDKNKSPARPRLDDPDFKYVPAKETDLRVTFQRIRAEQQQQLELPLDYPPIQQPQE
jgi:hypothetical protein